MQAPIRFALDRSSNAAYIHLTARSAELTGPTESVTVDAPFIHSDVVLDFRDGRLIGIEVLDADITLPYDLLDSAPT